MSRVWREKNGNKINILFRWQRRDLDDNFKDRGDLCLCLWCVCVSVSVCVRERDRETEREGKSKYCAVNCLEKALQGTVCTQPFMILLSHGFHG